MLVRDWGIALARSLYRRDPTLLVLQSLRQRARRVPGDVRLPFGRLRYVDGASCASQYEEIFIHRGYEFESRSTSPLILDCGAYIGLSAIYFARRYPGARITAFEADPAIAGVLRHNLDSLGLGQIPVVQAAVWDTDGSVRFHREGADGGHVLDGARDGVSDVPAVRLADRITEPVDLLKMDIEGSEFAVVEDLGESSKLGLVQAFVCELHLAKNRSALLPTLLETLYQSGFSVTVSHARPAPDLPGPVESTPFTAVADGRWLAHLYAWRGCAQ